MRYKKTEACGIVRTTKVSTLKILFYIALCCFENVRTEWEMCPELKITLSEATTDSYHVNYTVIAEDVEAVQEYCVLVNITGSEYEFNTTTPDVFALWDDYYCSGIPSGSENTAVVEIMLGNNSTKNCTTNETICTVPLAISNITTDSPTTESISISWQEPEGGHSIFHVYVNNTVHNSTASTSCILSGLEEHEFYYVHIQTGVQYLGCSENSTNSASHTFWTDFSAVQSVTVDETTNSTITVSWSHSAPNIIKYVVTCTCVDASPTVDCRDAHIESAAAGTSECTDLTAGAHYEVSLTAVGQESNKTTTSDYVAITKPNVVTDLRIDDTDQDSVTLEWDAPDKGGYSSYQIYINGSWIQEVTETKHREEGLTSSTLHNFHVVTLANYSDQSERSEDSEVLEAYTLPEAVQNLNSEAKAWNITVTWEPPPYVQSIEMYIVNVYDSTWQNCVQSIAVRETNSDWNGDRIEGNCSNIEGPYQNFNASDAEVTALVGGEEENDVIQPYSTYYVDVFAINEGGAGDNATAGPIQTAEAAPGGPVQNVSTHNITATSIMLTWEDPEKPYGEITGYDVTWTFDNCNSDNQESDTRNVTEKNITVEGLDEYWDFTFKVKARNSAGVSEDASHSEKTLATHPESVSNLKATSVEAREIHLQWDAVSPCDVNGDFKAYYLVYSYIDPLDGASDHFEETIHDIGNTSHTVSVSPYKNYTFQLILANHEYNSTNNEELQVQSDEDIPSEPTSLEPTPSNRTVDVTWEPPSEPNGVILAYEVSWCRQETDCSNDGGNDTTSPDTLHYQIRNLQPSAVYKISVRAQTAPGFGPASHELVQLYSDYPVAPSDVRVQALNSTALHVSWSMYGESTGNTSYNVTAVAPDLRCDPDTHTVTEIGFYKNQTIVANLQEHWNYSVTVVAYVTVEDGAQLPSDADDGEHPPPEQTHPSTPGAVQNMDHYKKEDICYEIQIHWEEPDICDQNGDMKSYRISWQSGEDGGDYNCPIEECESEDGSFVYTATDLVPNNASYVFTVVSVNEYSEGTESTIDAYTGLCAPVTPEESGVDSAEEKPAKPKSQIRIGINETFLTDASNGDLTISSIIVVNANDAEYEECCDSEDEFLDKFVSWDESKRNGFRSPYRIDYIPNESRRQKRSNSEYTVGEDEGCGGGGGEYCNGPLADGKSYKVALATCTVAGCAVGEYSAESFPTEKETRPDSGHRGDKDYTVLIACMSVLIVLLASVVVVGAVYMHRKGLWIFGQQRERASSHDEPVIRELHELESERKERPVKISRFKEHVQTLHKDTNMGFADEYEQLKDLSPCFDNDDALIAENRNKNRYTNILPFDNTRVKLLPIEDVEGSDYINANYMPGYNSKREFIAAQGPLPGTVDDFWRMIWEQHVSIVVMLTKLKERDRVKCTQYWPNDAEPAFYDDIKVHRRSESVIGDYVVRVLDISCGDRTRTVKQLHYIKWPDFGCPDDTNGLLNLVQVVRNEISPAVTGPVCVHCSAGVGRTGTFVCVDRLLQRMRDHDSLDVFGTILEMRHYRCTMVQSEDQYIYIHDCLNDAIERGMHLGQNQNVYSNMAMDGEEDGFAEPLYENWENGPGRNVLAAHQAALSPYSMDSEA